MTAASTNPAAAAVLSKAECTTTGNIFRCELGAAWDKGDTAEITMPVIATAGASGNVINRATVTDGNLTKNPEHPVIIQPADTTGVSIKYHKAPHLLLSLCHVYSRINNNQEPQRMSYYPGTRL
jgi:hypothetical protein